MSTIKNTREKLMETIKTKALEHFKKLGLEDEDAKELLEEGADSIQSKIFLISKTLKEENIEALIKLTHAIKGILLNLGLEEEATEFRKIKQLYEEGKSFKFIKEQTQKSLRKLIGKD